MGSNAMARVRTIQASAGGWRRAAVSCVAMLVAGCAEQALPMPASRESIRSLDAAVEAEAPLAVPPRLNTTRPVRAPVPHAPLRPKPARLDSAARPRPARGSLTEDCARCGEYIPHRGVLAFELRVGQNLIRFYHLPRLPKRLREHRWGHSFEIFYRGRSVTGHVWPCAGPRGKLLGADVPYRWLADPKTSRRTHSEGERFHGPVARVSQLRRWLRPGADLTGDGRPNLVLENRCPNDLRRAWGDLDLLYVEGGTTIWELGPRPRLLLSNQGGVRKPWQVLRDLDGDGRPEIIAERYRLVGAGVRSRSAPAKLAQQVLDPHHELRLLGLRRAPSVRAIVRSMRELRSTPRVMQWRRGRYRVHAGLTRRLRQGRRLRARYHR